MCAVFLCFCVIPNDLLVVLAGVGILVSLHLQIIKILSCISSSLCRRFMCNRWVKSDLLIAKSLYCILNSWKLFAGVPVVITVG